MASPYSGLPGYRFWTTGVRDQDWSRPSHIYSRKFAITRSMKVMTAGSCFAQHIARNLRARGYAVLDTEPAPSLMPEHIAREYGYGIYSARYGNLYTVRQLLQLLSEALGQDEQRNIVWEKGGRYFDALRPSIEPHGLDAPEDVAVLRKDHLARVRTALEQADLFVFTMGLTEAWIDRQTGTVFPTAPGTIAGSYDPGKHVFKNFGFRETFRDFEQALMLIKQARPRCKFLVTVSPVPLMATATKQHVLPATIYSKSVLRAVAGKLSEMYDEVDYFPSYEIVGTPFVGDFYEDDRRSVSSDGVEHVMQIFFAEHDAPGHERKEPHKPAGEARAPVVAGEQDDDEVICEELLLEAFAPR